MMLVYLGLGLLVVLVAIVIINTFRFQPHTEVRPLQVTKVNKKHAYESLSKLVQFKTISKEDTTLQDPKPFLKLKEYVKARYPRLQASAQYHDFETGMLFHLPGQASDKPVVLMAHYDVVPATGQWKDDPFSGKISTTAVYGRGTLDTKNSMVAILEAVETLLEKGHRFQQDVYLAFGGDEETKGKAAPQMVEFFQKKGVTPYFVLDEGGAIVSQAFPGVKKKTAVVGLTEKGFLVIELKAISKGGHASSPPPQTPLTQLAKAIVKLNKNKTFPMKLTPTVRAMFAALAPHSTSFFIRMLFANLWLFFPLIQQIALKNGGAFLALLKTTQAFTMAKGSDAVNVLPNEATIGIDYRLRPGETQESVIQRIQQIIADDSIQIKVLAYHPSPPASQMDEGFARLQTAIVQTWEQVIVAPYLMTAASDARHYHTISSRVYRFSPMEVTKEELATIHGDDEQIRLENIDKGVQFYLNLLQQLT